MTTPYRMETYPAQHPAQQYTNIPLPKLKPRADRTHSPYYTSEEFGHRLNDRALPQYNRSIVKYRPHIFHHKNTEVNPVPSPTRDPTRPDQLHARNLAKSRVDEIWSSQHNRNYYPGVYHIPFQVPIRHPKEKSFTPHEQFYAGVYNKIGAIENRNLGNGKQPKFKQGPPRGTTLDVSGDMLSSTCYKPRLKRQAWEFTHLINREPVRELQVVNQPPDRPVLGKVRAVPQYIRPVHHGFVQLPNRDATPQITYPMVAQRRNPLLFDYTGNRHFSHHKEGSAAGASYNLHRYKRPSSSSFHKGEEDEENYFGHLMMTRGTYKHLTATEGHNPGGRGRGRWAMNVADDLMETRRPQGPTGLSRVYSFRQGQKTHAGRPESFNPASHGMTTRFQGWQGNNPPAAYQAPPRTNQEAGPSSDSITHTLLR